MLILLAQLLTPIVMNKRKLLLLILVNPVVVLITIYSIKPSINYFNGRPTEIKCSYNAYLEPTFNMEKNVYLEYMDDDCDWLGWYVYTIDINNKITNKLISTFGNPI